jgi:membrane protease YdiL (CAAX protease family)
MHRRLIQIELATATTLIATAAAWSLLRDLDVGARLAPSREAVQLGVACGGAYALLLPLVTASWAPRIPLLRGLRRAWNGLELALGGGLSSWTIVLLAVCSAASEELFFRGVLQPEIGLVPASVVFGVLHPFGPAYVAWATTAGVGLGWLATSTGTLAASTAAHATYNLLALAYLRHRASRQEAFA